MFRTLRNDPKTPLASRNAKRKVMIEARIVGILIGCRFVKLRVVLRDLLVCLVDRQ